MVVFVLISPTHSLYPRGCLWYDCEQIFAYVVDYLLLPLLLLHLIWRNRWFASDFVMPFVFLIVYSCVYVFQAGTNLDTFDLRISWLYLEVQSLPWISNGSTPVSHNKLYNGIHSGALSPVLSHIAYRVCLQVGFPETCRIQSPVSVKICESDQ